MCRVGNRPGPRIQGKQVAAAEERYYGCVSRLSQDGQPTLIQTADRTDFPRTFSLDASGRILVVGNQNARLVHDGDTVKSIAAKSFRIRIRLMESLEFVAPTMSAVKTNPATCLIQHGSQQFLLSDGTTVASDHEAGRITRIAILQSKLFKRLGTKR